jgi:hypothetical protein
MIRYHQKSPAPKVPKETGGYNLLTATSWLFEDRCGPLSTF